MRVLALDLGSKRIGLAGQLADGVDLDAGLIERHEQEAQPLAPDRARRAAGDDEDPVGLVRERGPHLLPLQAPAPVLVLPAARADRRQVGAGAGLGVTLGPVFATFADAGQEATLLLGRAQRDQRRRGQGLADVAHAPRPTGAHVFFMEGELQRQRQVAPAVFLGPAQADPAAAGHFLLPLLAQRGIGLLVTRPAAMLQAGKAADEVGRHPGGDFLAKFLFIHALPSSQAALRQHRAAVLPGFHARRCSRPATGWPTAHA